MATKINQNGTKTNSSASAKLYKDRGSHDLFQGCQIFFFRVANSSGLCYYFRFNVVCNMSQKFENILKGLRHE